MFSDNAECNGASNCVPGPEGYCTTTKNGLEETLDWYGTMPVPFTTLVAVGGVDRPDFDPATTIVSWSLFLLGAEIPVPLSAPVIEEGTSPLYLLLGCWDGVSDTPTVLQKYVDYVPTFADCTPDA